MKRVVFYRAEQERDAFRSLFLGAGYEVAFCAVLDTVYVNKPHWPDEHVDSVAVTSRRSLIALARDPLLLEQCRNLVGNAPWFAVGPATALAARRLGFRVVGAQYGTSAGMVAPMVSTGAKSVLLICGDPHRTELEEGLREHGVSVFTTILYKTTSVTRHLPVPTEGWAVFFSPRGVETVADDLSGSGGALRLAAIGQTTASAMLAAGIPVDAVATEPTAEAVLNAIATSEENPSQTSNHSDA